MNKYILSLRNKLAHFPKTSIPLIVHYGVNRVISNKNPEENNKISDNSQSEIWRIDNQALYLQRI